LIKHELMVWTFLVRTLQRIGIVDIPARPTGRPPGKNSSLGITDIAQEFEESAEPPKAASQIVPSVSTATAARSVKTAIYSRK
jgi:hypothetical protein